MNLFEKKSAPQNEYLKKYMAMATRFQNVGIVIVAAAVALHYFGGSTLKSTSLLIFGVGAIALVFGGSSLRPHNLIKSFAQQCSREPDDIIADGLLEAMERNHKTALTKNSIRNIYLAIEIYATTPGADPELIERLKHAAEHNLTKKMF